MTEKDEIEEMFESTFDTCADGRRAERRFTAAEDSLLGHVSAWHTLEVALRRRHRTRVTLAALLDRLGVAADRIAALVAAVVDDAPAFDRHEPDAGPPPTPLLALATTSPHGPPAGLVRESALGGRALL